MERRLVLRLDPVPGCSPTGRAVFDFSEGGRQFWVAGSLTPTSGSSAEMVLDSGPSERPPRDARLIPASDVAFALFVSPAGRQCLPALDVGARGLRVEASAPLGLGAVLADLIVLYRQQVLRTGEGTITSCSPAIYPDGRLVYECGVRLRNAATPRADHNHDERIEIDEASRVRAILWGLCDLEYEVTLSGPTGLVRGRIQQIKGVADRSRAPELRCQVADADRIPVRSGTVTVECSLFGSGYCFFARVIDRRGDVLTLSPAPKLREWHRRGEERTGFSPDGAATVTFLHPLAGAQRTRSLADLSPHGFSLSPDVKMTICGRAFRWEMSASGWESTHSRRSRPLFARYQAGA